MSFSNRRVHRVAHFKRSAITAVIIAAMAFTLSPVQADKAGEQARDTIESVIKFLGKSPLKRKPPSVKSQDFKGPVTRASEVKHLRLCPRELLLYVGESFTLVPLPLDRTITQCTARM
jgi:hypothetical protein